MLLSHVSADAAVPEAQPVMNPIHDFFDGLAHHDKAAMMRQVTLQGGVSSLRGGELRYLAFAELADHIAQDAHRISEQIGDPIVRIDEDVAMVWAPYVFYTDGKIDHCGTDVFNLLRIQDQWYIAGAADNSRTDCANWAHSNKN